MRRGTDARDRISELALKVRLTSLLECCPRSGSVLVLTYHRIGNWQSTPHDEQVFSATREEFEVQIALLRKMTVISLGEALDLLLHNKKFSGTVILLTFDDGYLDSYQTAFPILQNAGLPGTFFLVSSFVGSNQLPWWDEIPFLVRKSRLPQIELDYPCRRSIVLGSGRRRDSIRRLVRLYNDSADGLHFLTHLRDRCSVESGWDTSERLFLDWREAREMAAAGMDIGAHTHSHRNLGHLSLTAQITELDLSRRRLEFEMGRRVDVLAYPYGTRDSLGRDTSFALRATGYRAAFSCYGGLNRSGRTVCYNVMRYNVNRTNTLPRFRLRLASSPIMKGYWF